MSLISSHHFRQQLGGEVVDSLSHDAQGGQDENDAQDNTGSEEEEEERATEDQIYSKFKFKSSR